VLATVSVATTLASSLHSRSPVVGTGVGWAHAEIIAIEPDITIALTALVEAIFMPYFSHAVFSSKFRPSKRTRPDSHAGLSGPFRQYRMRGLSPFFTIMDWGLWNIPSM
jgi:hypothetical protein